jgi:hypothetical protein
MSLRNEEHDTMTSLDLALMRLDSQQIRHPAFRRPGEVVARLGALQAQDYNGALWAVGLRMPAATVTDIRNAINDRTIVRTWLLRGTLHFVSPEDVRIILGLLAPHIIAGNAGRHRQLGLTGEDFARSRALFSEELRGGRQLTRDELFHILGKAGISPEGQRGYHLLGKAGLEGLICFGPHRGSQPTFVLLDEWVPEGRAAGQEGAAGAWLAQRYFTGHGPATLKDFVWWSGLTVSDAKAGIHAAGSRLSPVTLHGKEYFMASPLPDPLPGEPAAYLLPGFDEYILGYQDRSPVLDPSVAGRTALGGNGMMPPTVVIEGSVAGTWKRTIGKREIAISVHPFSPMTPSHRDLVLAAAERYGKFIGMPAVVEW